MYTTRRDLGRLALAALPLSAFAAKINSKVNGVQLGAQTYSFRDRSLDDAIKAMQELGIGACELYQGHLEPKGDAAAKKKWRETVNADELKAVKSKFDAAGITIYAFNYSFREDFSDREIERGFEMAKALGTNKITASSNVSTAARIDPLAQKYKTYVGFHNHSNLKDNEFARPEDFEKAMAGKSKFMAINLDIGHFTAAGFDPVQYLEQHHDRILTLHIKDRKANQGANVVFGEGDTKIKEVLQLLKTKHYPIPAMIEYEYKGADTVAEVKKCLDYCRQALA